MSGSLAGRGLRRIVKLLVVMAVIATMAAVSAMPAFAAKGGGALVIECQGVGQQGNIVETPSGNVLNHCGSGGSTGGGATVITAPCSKGNIVLAPSGNVLNHCTIAPPPA
jgi:hypothetical protein